MAKHRAIDQPSLSAEDQWLLAIRQSLFRRPRDMAIRAIPLSLYLSQTWKFAASSYDFSNKRAALDAFG